MLSTVYILKNGTELTGIIDTFFMDETSNYYFVDSLNALRHENFIYAFKNSMIPLEQLYTEMKQSGIYVLIDLSDIVTLREV